MTIKALRMLAVAVLVVPTLGTLAAEAGRPSPSGTVQMLLDLGARPFAIAHRGFGDNDGEDSSRPIENTIPAVRRGYLTGASVVEVDVQLTRDGEVAVYHDDFLSDFTCLNALTMAELQARVPYVPSLQAVLNQARKFNQSSGPLRGLLIVELKAAAPLCDPLDTHRRRNRPTIKLWRMRNGGHCRWPANSITRFFRFALITSTWAFGF